MNSALKLLLCRTNGKSVFGTIVRNLKVTQKCLLFDERYLGLEPLWKEQEKLKAAILEKKEKAAFDLEDVMKFTRKNARILMAGSNSGEDIKHLVNLTEKFIKEGLFSTVELRGFILQVFRVAYACDQIDLVLGMFDNEIIKPHVSGTFAGLIVMDKLYRQKRYDAVIELFDKQFKDYSEEKSFSEMAPFMFRQKVPYDQLSCVIAALLALNSRESFQKLKTVVDSVSQVGSSINRRSVARAFLLSINQGDAKFALNLVHSFAFTIDLRLNLEIIALCLLNKPYQGFVLAEEMFSIRWSDSLNFQGRFFPLVFKSFEEAIERSSHQSEYLKRYNYIKEKANRLRRISPVDLEQYCSSSEK